MQMTDVPYFIKRVAIHGPSFDYLADIAIRQLEPFNGQAEVVCGPISTGGCGDVFRNLLAFNHAIEVLQAHGRPMWSQIPFEAGLAELEFAWKKANPTEPYCTPILTDFYFKFLTPRYIKRAWFLGGVYGWETSTGAKMEWTRLQEQGIDCRIYEESWHRTCVLPADV